MPVIVAENLVKRFSGRAVLAGVSFTVDAGETVAVLGRSGTGKSVLLKTRVGLARAIMNLPQVVLYDEPTTGLDPVTTDVINQIILRLRAKLKVTSIVVTHDIKSAFTISDRIIMLDQGRIVAEGTPEQIQ